MTDQQPTKDKLELKDSNLRELADLKDKLVCLTKEKPPKLETKTQKEIVNLGLTFYKASMGFDDTLEVAQETLDKKKWCKKESVEAVLEYIYNICSDNKVKHSSTRIIEIKEYIESVRK